MEHKLFKDQNLFGQHFTNCEFPKFKQDQTDGKLSSIANSTNIIFTELTHCYLKNVLKTNFPFDQS